MDTFSKVLITLGILMYGVAPLVADLNPSHLLHPDWTPYSRLHMAWLLATNSSIAILAAYFLWIKDEVLLSGILPICVLGGFWVAALTSGFYGGAYSDIGGIEAKVMGFYGNAIGFALALLSVAIGLALNQISRTR